MHGVVGHALYGRFLRGLELSPDRVAVGVGGESFTYREMHRTALRWAGAITRMRPGPVGVLAAKGATAYTGLLAALFAGAAVVPLRPDFPAARTRQMLEASGARVVVVDGQGAAVLSEMAVDDVEVLAPEVDPVPAGFALTEPRAVSPQDPAYVLFTSGSTGRPKGVVITHGCTDHYFRLLDRRYDFGPDDVFSQTFDLNFDLVRTTAAYVLGHERADMIDPDADFLSLGFDSLTAIEFRNRLTAIVGARLEATLVFDHPSVTAVAARLRTEVAS